MKRIKVYGKIKLYETSAVGIPAYPDAHASVNSFSLIKALHGIQSGFVEEANDISEELNSENETMSDETIPTEKATEVPIEKSEVAETEDKNSDMSDTIAKAIEKGIKEGLDKLTIDRGLVENNKVPAIKSLGELAIEQGLFVQK